MKTVKVTEVCRLASAEDEAARSRCQGRAASLSMTRLQHRLCRGAPFVARGHQKRRRLEIPTVTLLHVTRCKRKGVQLRQRTHVWLQKEESGSGSLKRVPISARTSYIRASGRCRSRVGPKNSAPERCAQASSCSAAAARKVSPAANSTWQATIEL